MAAARSHKQVRCNQAKLQTVIAKRCAVSISSANAKKSLRTQLDHCQLHLSALAQVKEQ
jgi:hypothetical protein